MAANISWKNIKYFLEKHQIFPNIVHNARGCVDFKNWRKKVDLKTLLSPTWDILIFWGEYFCGDFGQSVSSLAKIIVLLYLLLCYCILMWILLWWFWSIRVASHKKSNCSQQIAFGPTQHVSICINFDMEAELQFVHFSSQIKWNNNNTFALR